jgi:tellurite methyltransferase
MAQRGAVETWDSRWSTAEGRAEWLDPDPEVIALVPELTARAARRVLDLGCGVGRHALCLAERGFSVEALDGSAAGLAFAGDAARRRGLELGLHQGEADALPFPDASFDFVLSWNVIYHGAPHEIAHRIAEIRRVLRPGGLYQGTMLPKRNVNYGHGTLVAPDTFVDSDPHRAHPHFYCDAAGLVALFAGFELLSLTQRQHRKPGSWHWHVLAQRALGLIEGG